ncbi:unnamed protein product [Rotaria sp. Silwood1]|nr:unnamed protein product [Rotaria sp. Silwood1]CAF3606135.1 unnamed protein product [Rotaria sp. Silwood1]CAF4637710.1 unnamed protein product [Rotaria sp. Silwood1]CAF4753596.1 unnamed protein product [Rotaria sp. Silwood1]
MDTRLEHFPNELLFDVFGYFDARDLFHGFWGLNKRFNQLLQSLRNLSLTIEKDESKLISLFACHINRLVIDTCLNIDFTQFPYLHSLVLYQLTENQLKQIQVKFIPHLVYLSIPSDNTSYDIPRLIQKIFSPELFSLRHVNLGYLYVSQFQWSQSHSLHSISVCCTSSVMVLHILASSPNLSTLHAHFEKNNFNIFHEIPSITNHPLKYFTLSDPYSVLCFKHIDTFLLYMPYVQRIKLNFNCDVPFIHFAQTVSNRLLYLRRFDCHIDNAPDDEITSDETIRQIHPCFNCIQCTIDDYGYRTYTTD